MSDNSKPQGTGTAEMTDADLDAYLDNASDETEQSLNGEDEEEIEEVEAKSDDDEEPSDDEDADPDEDKEEQADEDPEIEIGDGVVVKLSELKQGYQRTADYTRKTQALAAEQKKLEATTALFAQQAKAIEERKTQLEETFDVTIELLSQQIPPKPDPALAYSDPATYNAQKAYHDLGVERVQQAIQEKRNAQEKLAKAEQENNRSRMMVEAQKLENAFPHIKGNPEKREALWKSTYDAAGTLGISAQEMDAVTDARIIIGLAKLAAYQAREKAQPKPAPKAEQKIKQAVRPQSSVAPRKAVPSSAPKSLRAFRETRSVNAAERAWQDIDIDKI